jgi:hypothetical protein
MTAGLARAYTDSHCPATGNPSRPKKSTRERSERVKGKRERGKEGKRERGKEGKREKGKKRTGKLRVLGPRK